MSRYEGRQRTVVFMQHCHSSLKYSLLCFLSFCLLSFCQHVLATTAKTLNPDDYLSDQYREIITSVQQELTLSEEEQAWLRQHPVIRLGIDADFTPYSFLKSENEYQGVVVDYLAILSKALHVEFQVAPGLSWSAILNQAQAREIDMIATASIRPERQEYLSFTEFFIPTPQVIMARKADAKRFSDPASLQQSTLAVVRDYAIGKRVVEDFPSNPIKVFESPLAALQALATGEVDAYVGVLGVNSYLVREHGLTNLAVAGRYDLAYTGQRFAIRKDWPMLRQILDKTLSLISKKQRYLILDNWSSAMQLPEVSERELFLTADETTYIERKKQVTMCVDPNWMPYERINAQEQHIGIAADYMQMFSGMLGIQIQLVATESWSQSESYAEERKCDILSMLNHSEKRAKFLNFTDPYIEAPVVLVAHQNVTYLDGLKSLSGKSFGLVKGYVYEDLIKKSYPDIDLVYVDNMDDALKKISSGEIYATIGSLYIITTQIQELGLSDLKIAGHTEFTNLFRVGVRNDDEMLLQLFQKAVTSRDPQQENEILRKWISVRIEQGFDYALLWQILAAIAILFGFFIYRHMVIGNYNRKLTEKNQQLEMLSRTDALTGVSNRMRLDEILSYELDQAKRYQHPLSVIILDIDDFKAINDQFGHQVGDKVLVRVADSISNNIRAADTFGRWGGEEFVLVCPQTTLREAELFADKLRAHLKEDNGEGLPTTSASFGVTNYRQGDTKSSILTRADSALYQAKNNGKNQVAVISAD